MISSVAASPPGSHSAMRIPGSWSREALRLHLAGRLEETVKLALRDAGMCVERFEQAACCVRMHGDRRAGLLFCRESREILKRRPGDVEMPSNACVCCTKLHKCREAVSYAERMLAVNPDNTDACDMLAHACGRLQDMPKAREVGTRALMFKGWAVPKASSGIGMNQPAGVESFLREARQRSPCVPSRFSAPTTATFATPSTTSLSQEALLRLNYALPSGQEGA